MSRTEVCLPGFVQLEMLDHRASTCRSRATKGMVSTSLTRFVALDALDSPGPRRLVVVDPTGALRPQSFAAEGYAAHEVVLIQPVPDKPPTISQQTPRADLERLGRFHTRFNGIDPRPS